MSDNINEIEEELYDARETLVGRAEAHGVGDIFKDEQSINDMKQQIESIEDTKIKKDLMEQFQKVEKLFEEYTSKIVGEEVKNHEL